MEFCDYWRKSGDSIAKRHEGEDDRAFARRIVKAAWLKATTEERGRCVTAVKESVEGFSEVPDHVIESLQDRETARTATLTIAESFALVSIDAINTPNH
ncbi:hypothetical protein [Gilvimarinus chinensis]|uniref:hypothetical protein n=1 Tax=Gilvimarinus chinensis TaxID=396005 RepID=UPI00037892DE|nr:hypothetical protein [Gilvimarinus chinensis]